MSNKDSVVIFNKARKKSIEDKIAEEGSNRYDADQNLLAELNNAIAARKDDCTWLDKLSDNPIAD